MTATLEVQPNTLVALPDVSASALREIVARMQAQEPEQRDRIGRGLVTLLGSEIRATEETGVFLVQSAADSGLFYRATTFACCCADDQRRGHGCKHARACQILTAASAAARYESWVENFAARRLARKGGVAS